MPLLLEVLLLTDSGIRMLRLPYRLDELADESRSDVAELGSCSLGEPFFEHQLDDLLQLDTAELVLLDLPLPPPLVVELKGKLVHDDLALLPLLLAATLQLHDRARMPQLVVTFVCGIATAHRSRLGSEACSQLGGELAKLQELFLA